jgi:predicted metal-dependent peptidase
MRSVEASKAAQVDWRELLRRAWSETIPADYSWTRPNRRHVWTGLYLPGVVCEGVGEICIAVDCSGSIHDRQLGFVRGGDPFHPCRPAAATRPRAVL